MKGSARVTVHSETGREVSYGDIGPGDIFGELAGTSQTTKLLK
ncbi:hypothetical protein [Sinorhizobium sp. CB9]